MPRLRCGCGARLGSVPFWTASGSDAVARQVMGTTVIGGMLAATLIAIFLIPVTYYVVERFADRRDERAAQDAVRAGTN
jgi:HAE1 family hydrophobic/amphiphilic exporter-1